MENVVRDSRFVEFGSRIRAARDGRGLTQAALAEQLSTRGIKMHQTAIAKIEAGSRPTTVVEAQAIADVLLVSIADLLGIPDERSTRTTADLVFAAAYDDMRRAFAHLRRAAREYTDAHESLLAATAAYETAIADDPAYLAAHQQVHGEFMADTPEDPAEFLRRYL
jgi:transcriptional regulator with XRE-family HTH domain